MDPSYQSVHGVVGGMQSPPLTGALTEACCYETRGTAGAEGGSGWLGTPLSRPPCLAPVAFWTMGLLLGSCPVHL